MDHSPGFSVHEFGVAAATAPSDAWVCQFTIGGPKWLSSVDMTSGLGGIECTYQDASMLHGYPEITLKSLLEALDWLKGLP